MIGSAIAVLGWLALFLIEWLAVAGVLAVGWAVVVGALLLAQALSMWILNGSDTAVQQRSHERILWRIERKRGINVDGNRGAAQRRPLLSPHLLRCTAACLVALALGIGASVLMLRT